MKTFLTKSAAIAMVLAVASFAAAGGSGGGGKGGAGKFGGGGSMHEHHYGTYGGRSFSHGVYYPRDCFHWNYRCYSSRYGCDVYWCPTDSCYYYYYCPSACCYYPVTYIAYAPPVVTTQVVTTTQFQTLATQAVAGPPPTAQRPDGVPAAP